MSKCTALEDLTESLTLCAHDCNVCFGDTLKSLRVFLTYTMFLLSAANSFVKQHTLDSHLMKTNMLSVSTGS